MPKDQIITTEDVKDPAASKPMDKFQALVARLDDDGIRAAVETLEEPSFLPVESLSGCTIPASTTRTRWR